METEVVKTSPFLLKNAVSPLHNFFKKNLGFPALFQSTMTCIAYIWVKGDESSRFSIEKFPFMLFVAKIRSWESFVDDSEIFVKTE